MGGGGRREQRRGWAIKIEEVKEMEGRWRLGIQEKEGRERYSSLLVLLETNFAMLCFGEGIRK